MRQRWNWVLPSRIGSVSLTFLTQAVSNVCKSALWERIAGWEVVIVATIVVIGWVTVQVARMYYMAEVAKIGTRTEFIPDDKQRG